MCWRSINSKEHNSVCGGEEEKVCDGGGKEYHPVHCEYEGSGDHPS